MIARMNRPTPRWNQLLGSAKRTFSRAATLFASAGRASHTDFEHLEQRQLLFALTITPEMVNPVTGLGTVRAYFGYAIPYLAPTEEVDQDAEQTEYEEDFNQNDPGIPGTFAAFIPTGFQWTSGFRVIHNVTRMELVREPGSDSENEVEVSMRGGQSFSLVLSQYNVPVEVFELDVNTQFNFDRMRIELVADGEVLASFEGNDLLALAEPTERGWRLTFEAPEPPGYFRELRFVPIGTENRVFRFDNLYAVVGARPYDDIVESRIFGAAVAFSGPVGATAEFFDLYGRPMRETLAVGPVGDFPMVLIDPDGDGIPNFNDGIGRIIMTNTDGRSALTMFGGTIRAEETPPADADFWEDGFAFFLAPLPGLFDEFMDGGFGYAARPDGATFEVSGLPEVTGSVILGSPFVRPLETYNPGGPVGGMVLGGFNRPDQGVFVVDGSNMGSVYIHGILHGSSKFHGYLHHLTVGYMVGSAQVKGDLGYLTVGTDAGLWVDSEDDGVAPNGARAVKTQSHLLVERTLGEVAIAGRSLMDITVLGDLNSPETRPARDVLRYYEREFVTHMVGQNIPAVAVVRNILNNNDFLGAQQAVGLEFLFRPFDQSRAFATGIFRNDSITSAEWIGSIGTAVQLRGELGRRNPVSTAVDPVDVFAFPVDGTQDVIVSSVTGAAFRIVDQDGRTLAATQLGRDESTITTMRFTPDAPGVYYLVVQTNSTSQTQAEQTGYLIELSGLAPVAFGAYRTGGGSGNIPGTNLTNNINVLSGSMGSVRVGMGFITGGGAEGDVDDVFNTHTAETNPGYADEDAWMDMRAGAYNIRGNLYNVTAGSDIDGSQFGHVTFNVDGHIGNVVTGMHPEVGLDPEEGDLRYTHFNVGGSIGMLDIRGGIGLNQDTPDEAPPITDGLDSVVIRTGLEPTLKGDIGFIRAGSHVGGDTLVVMTSPGSTIGGFVVSQDIEYEESDPVWGIAVQGGQANGARFTLGPNSDLRFFDTPRIDMMYFINHTLTIPTDGSWLRLTDDAGGQVDVRITGGGGLAFGELNRLPLNHSAMQGVAIGRMNVNLGEGGVLEINSRPAPGGNEHIISIGRISLLGSDENSAIRITGPSQVDVWRIVDVEGDGLNEIVNTTPRGDIVAIDVATLNRIQIGTGNLGRTQMPSWGPTLIGPFLGIATSGAGVEGPIALPAAAMTGFWNGSLYRPVNQSNFGVPPSAWLDDVGSPITPYLNGVIVRNGGIQSVEVGGAIGDVMAPDGTIGNVIANADGVTPRGEFHGIVGNIYGNRVGRVDIGDGLAPRAISAPLATTGIIATDDIQLVTSRPALRANISSNIIAANITPLNTDPQTFPTDGIHRIELRGGGSYVNAWIGATTLDAFWWSVTTADSALMTGTVNEVFGQDAHFLRSTLEGLQLNSMRMLNGYYDASSVHIHGNITLIEAAGFRNSTVDGGWLEYYDNTIRAGAHITTLRTINRAGDMNDLRVEAGGRTQLIAARNISRSQFHVSLEIERLDVVQSMRGSEIVSGKLTNATFGQSVRSSLITVAGPIVSFTVNDEVTTSSIRATGPDGEIVTMTVRNLLEGSIFSSGRIGTIRVTHGDMIARITTVTNNLHGHPSDVGTLQAARDLDIRTDIGGTINQLIAGRHIGNRLNPGVILARGSIVDIQAPNGQLYSDVRIGDNLQNATIGRAIHRPAASNLGRGSIIAYGRIENITIHGDFAGDIISYSGGIGVITINNGSFLPGAQIAAYDGHLTNLFINSGNLYGNVHADYHIFAIRLNGSADGVFGHIGINPAFSAGTAYDEFRNQHPAGVIHTSAIQGPRITAGHNLGRVILTNGSMFEAFLYAGRAIGTVEVNGNISNNHPGVAGHGTVIAAGSTIFTVRAFGSVSDTMILVGVRDFGANGRPGGTGADRDTVGSGRLEHVDIRGNARNVIVSAGMDPGADGMYNTGDELVAMGISYVRNVLVGGSVDNVSVFADSRTLNYSSGIDARGFDFAQMDPDIHGGAPIGVLITPGVPMNFNWNGASGTIIFNGSGIAYWDEATGRLALVNTSLHSELLVTDVSGGALRDFRIISNDNASMGSIRVDANLFGESRIVVDAFVLSIQTGDLNDNSQIRVGMNLRRVETGNINGGSITGLFWVRDVIINGDLGTTAAFHDGRVSILAGQTITVTGNQSGTVNVERDLVGAMTVNGSMNRGMFRSGASVGSMTMGEMAESRISVRDSLGPVVINGRAWRATIQAGGDLGADVRPGDPDNVATTGQIQSVTVRGDFVESNIVAGILRGPDGFFGTQDDDVAPGRSTIGNVTIAGVARGSNWHSEQYRISSTGNMGSVTVNGQPGVSQGNFRIDRLDTMSMPIQVTDLRPTLVSETWTMWIYFNQEMNESTIGPALSIAEVRRDSNEVLQRIPLTEGVHYTLTDYDPILNRIGVVFAREVTDRNLDNQTGQRSNQPGPGVYRFEFDAEVLRARVVDARLTANPEGFGNTLGNFSQDAIVGDAGDKIEPGIVAGGGIRIDFFPPVDLDLVLDNNYTPNGLPDINSPYTIHGWIGAHPDHGPDVFRVAADTDLYKITLRAGQILRLGAMEGSARLANRFLLDSDGIIQSRLTSNVLELPSDPLTLIDLTQSAHYLIKETGTYYIAITNDTSGAWNDLSSIPSINQTAGTVGGYRFTIEVADDRRTGFSADTESGDGMALVNAPEAILFAGPSGVFGTADDRHQIVIGDFTFRLDPGPDGIRGTADDIVIGTSSDGSIVSRRVGDTLTTTVHDAIGPRGFAGVPGTATPDIDIYHLNNRQPIAPGQLITVTLQLAEMGADLGSFSPQTFVDFRGDVQFAVFDTTNSTRIDDAVLVFSPKDFKPIAGSPGIIGVQGDAMYGFDENGDFFISFVTPGQIEGTMQQAATYAIYLQGVFNTDYRMEVVQSAATQNRVLPRASQNVLIETRGGLVDWLEVGGLTTELAPFAGAVLGFTGRVGGVPVDQYIINNMLSNLQSLFSNAGVSVNISTNPSHFEFQDYSKVFLTSSNDPTAVFHDNTFGHSQRSDPFNFHRNDESIVFLPAFSTLGYTPSGADVDHFISSLTAAVGRRIGELLGLRMTRVEFNNDVRDIMASNSVQFVGRGNLFGLPPAEPLGGNYAFKDVARPLSGPWDTDGFFPLIPDSNFYLGYQNSLAMLQRFVLP